MPRFSRRALLCALTALTALFTPAPARASTLVGGPFLGATGYYDYSDSGIRDDTSGLETHWWCGDLPSHVGDTILEQQTRMSDGAVTIPEREVLAEGPAGAWDSLHTCNPTVVRGSFADPFGDGVTYTYAMYYVGVATGTTGNSIGAAFSLDGSTWRKYPVPVLACPDPGRGYYCYAQPNATVIDGRVWLLFEDSDAPTVSPPGPVPTSPSPSPSPNASGSTAPVTTHWYSFANPDGVTFAGPALISTAGLPSPVPSWGGAAYDSQDGRWYAAFNVDPSRAPSASNGNVAENGQAGVVLYATANLNTGPWVQLDTIDTALTGSEANFIAGLLRNPDGTLASAFLPLVQLDVSESWPRPAYNAWGSALGNSGQFNTWQVSWSRWSPGQPWRALQRVDYAGGHQYATTGWWDSSVYHLVNINLGKLAEAPTGTATVPLYLCKFSGTDYVDTLHSDCLGQYKAGMLGYISPTPGTGLMPIYSCVIPGVGHMVSPDPACEGQQVDTLEPAGLLGYSQT